MTSASATDPRRHSPFALAFGAFVLALTTPLILVLAWKLGKTFELATSIGAPLIALSVLFAFAFHVRFALGAFEGQKRLATVLASVAIVVGVTGFVGAMLVLMRIVVVD